MKKPFFFWTALLFVPLAGCIGTATGTKGGTDVGNPDSHLASNTGSMLSQAACDTVNFCRSGFDRWDCAARGMDVPDVASSVGLKGTSTLRQLDTAIEQNKAALSQSQLDRCLEKIRSLRCAEIPVDTIWNVQDPSNYRGLINFWNSVRSVCGNVVTPKR
jgi:hypothetical protein